MHPQLAELIDTCARHHVGHVVLAGGLPPGGAIERIKTSGAKLVCFAPALALALDATHQPGPALSAAEQALRLAPGFSAARALSDKLRR